MVVLSVFICICLGIFLLVICLNFLVICVLCRSCLVMLILLLCRFICIWIFSIWLRCMMWFICVCGVSSGYVLFLDCMFVCKCFESWLW